MTKDEIIDAIAEVDKTQINEIVKAAYDRMQELFPDWDVFYFALPREDYERRMQSIWSAHSFIREVDPEGKWAELLTDMVIVALKEVDEGTALHHADLAMDRMQELFPDLNLGEFFRDYDPEVKAAREAWVKDFLAKKREEEDWNAWMEEAEEEEQEEV